MASNTEVTYLGSGFNPSELDVIVGRGKVCYKHSGNLRLARIVQSVLGTYSSAEATKKSKTELIKSIVSQVRESSPEGGFVKFDSEKGEWFEVGDRTAREKVSQAFRDALTDQYKSSSTSKTLKRRQERITRQTSNDGSTEPGTPGGTLPPYGAAPAADPVASLPFGSMSLASPNPRRGVRGVGLPSPSPRRSYTLPSRPAPRLSMTLGTASPRTSLGLGTVSPRTSMSSCLPSPGGNSLAALTASPGSTFGLTASPGAASFGGLASASPGAASLQGFGSAAASPSPAAAMRGNLVSPLSAGFSTSPGRQQLSRFSASPSPLTMSLQNVGVHGGMPPVHGESPSSIRLAVAIAERKRRLTNLNMMMAARGGAGLGGAGGAGAGQVRPNMGGAFGGGGRPQVPHTL